MSQTNAEYLAKRQVHKPGFLIYVLCMLLIRVWNRIVHTRFIYRARPTDEKGSFVLVSNHASRNDFLFTAPVAWPRRMNYIVGYNEFYRFPINFVLKHAQVIPKRNFVVDVHCIRQAINVIRQGGAICFMPEGMSSITGMCQPVMLGTGAFLKKLGAPVYYTVVSGGYLTYTKHHLAARLGKINVVVDRMFTSEQLASLSPEEIEDTMNRLLAHDDYQWNKLQQIQFHARCGMAEKLETLLYYCPKCGAMGHNVGEGNRLRCTACGNTVEIDNCYNLHPVGESDVCPELVSDWALLERQRAAEQVREPDFCFSDHVRVGTLPEHGSLMGGTSNITGEGTLTLTREGLGFSGTVKGQPLQFLLPPATLPTLGMVTDTTHCAVYYQNEFYEFFTDSTDMLRWDHLVEELHRSLGGKWHTTPYR